jgi:hypothetical protein
MRNFEKPNSPSMKSNLQLIRIPHRNSVEGPDATAAPNMFQAEGIE